LDAEATQIQIKLWGHGLTQFTVRDNGSGITYPDLAIAGRRYYTSKLGTLIGSDTRVGSLAHYQVCFGMTQRMKAQQH
jgi:hypothetical protein